MNWRRVMLFAGVVGLFCVAPVAHAQQQQGTTIQLPQFSYFTVNTTVVAPDRGGVLMGGIDRSSEGRNEFGVPMLSKVPMFGRPFRNAGIGSERSSSRISVHPYIHDFEAMDQALLAQAAAKRGESQIAGAGQGQQFAGFVADRNADRQAVDIDRPGVTSRPAVVEETQTQRSEATRISQDVHTMMERGEAAEARGRPNLAKVYYRVVLKDSDDPELKAQAQARLAALGASSTTKLAAQSANAPAR